MPQEAFLRHALRDDRLGRVPRDGLVLELGCGTSSVAAALSDAGFRDVLGLDLSARAVADAKARHASRPGLRFARADARALCSPSSLSSSASASSSPIAAGSVAAVLDKGTLDAICCGDGFDWEAGRVAASLVRALQPGGVWVCASLMPPTVVLPLVRRAEWSLSAEPVPEAPALTIYTGVIDGGGASGLPEG